MADNASALIARHVQAQVTHLLDVVSQLAQAHRVEALELLSAELYALSTTTAITQGLPTRGPLPFFWR